MTSTAGRGSAVAIIVLFFAVHHQYSPLAVSRDFAAAPQQYDNGVHARLTLSFPPACLMRVTSI